MSVSKREKRKVNHLHPYISINFKHAFYKENVVKNQELFQVCDRFFSFFISLTLTQQWIINCLILFSITISLWGNRTGIKVVVHVIVLTNSSLTWNPDAWLLLYSLFSTDALLKLWRHEELKGLYKVTLICIGWQLFDWLIKLKIEIILTVCWSCGEVCRVLVSNKVNQIQEVTSGVHCSMRTLIPWA